MLLMLRITLDPKPSNSLIHCKLASLGVIACMQKRSCATVSMLRTSKMPGMLTTDMIVRTFLA